MDEKLQALRDSLTALHGSEIDTVRFDGNSGSRIVADVLDECRSGGLMSRHKIVLVDNADQLVKAEDSPAAKVGRRAPTPARELLETYAHAPSDAATLVLRAETWRPGNLDKAVAASGGAIVKCEPPGVAQATQWAQARAKSHHRTSLDPQAAAMLVEFVGDDLGRIDSELEKLATAAGGDGQPITPDLIQTMVGTTRTEDFWAIQGALLTGDAGAALGQLRELIEVSRHDPVPITFTYVEMARKVHVAARGLVEGVTPARMEGVLKIWGPDKHAMLDRVMSVARAIGTRQAAALLEHAVRVDAANKSGLGDPVRNLERLTLRFAALARKAGGAGTGAVRAR